MKKRIIATLLILRVIFTVTGCDLERSGVTLKDETVGIIGDDAVIETQEVGVIFQTVISCKLKQMTEILI